MAERKRKAFIHEKGPRGRLTATFAVVAGLLGVWAGGADLLVPIAASSWPGGAVGGAPKERLVRIARGDWPACAMQSQAGVPPAWWLMWMPGLNWASLSSAPRGRGGATRCRAASTIRPWDS